MRHATSSRRSRNRNNNGNRRGNQNRTQVFDSNGPDVRIRGTAYQICEKYMALAKDAASSGDAILAESYLQHAEHYQRQINSWQDDNAAQQQQKNQNKEVDDAYGNKADDDLSLPASILGKKADVQPKEKEVLEEA